MACAHVIIDSNQVVDLQANSDIFANVNVEYLRDRLNWFHLITFNWHRLIENGGVDRHTSVEVVTSLIDDVITNCNRDQATEASEHQDDPHWEYDAGVGQCKALIGTTVEAPGQECDSDCNARHTDQQVV